MASKKPEKLNSKWAAFARACESGEYKTDADAYGSVYPDSKDGSRIASAYRLSIKPCVQAERMRIRDMAVQVIAVNQASLAMEFEEARQLAKEKEIPAAMVSATMGKARIYGLDKVTVKVEASEELTPWGMIESGVTTQDDI